MEHSIKLQTGETLYHPLHEELMPAWEAIVIAQESFEGTAEFKGMVASYIAMRLQSEEGCLWEDRSSSWYEDYEQEQREAWSA